MLPFSSFRFSKTARFPCAFCTTAISVQVPTFSPCFTRTGLCVEGSTTAALCPLKFALCTRNSKEAAPCVPADCRDMAAAEVRAATGRTETGRERKPKEMQNQRNRRDIMPPPLRDARQYSRPPQPSHEETAHPARMGILLALRHEGSRPAKECCSHLREREQDGYTPPSVALTLA